MKIYTVMQPVICLFGVLRWFQHGFGYILAVGFPGPVITNFSASDKLSNDDFLITGVRQMTI